MSLEQLDLAAPAPTVPAVTLRFEPFSPGEAQAITGVSVHAQLSYRKRGLLLSRPGEHSRFDVFGLAWLHALGQFSELGGPRQAARVARDVALGSAWHALHDRAAYAGAYDAILSWDRAAMAKIEAAAAAMAYLRKPGLTVPEIVAEVTRLGPGDGFNARTRADWLRREIFRRGGFATPGRWHVWFRAAGEAGYADSLDHGAFGGLSSDPRYSGPGIVSDVAAFGGQLLDRAPRPFVIIQLAP